MRAYCGVFTDTRVIIALIREMLRMSHFCPRITLST